MHRKLNQLTGLDNAAVRAMQEMDRKLNPFGGIGVSALRELERRADPFGFSTMQRSFADRVTTLTRTDAFAAAFEASRANSALEASSRLSETIGAASRMFEFSRSLRDQFAIVGLDQLRGKLPGVLAEDSVFARSFDAFDRVRGRLDISLGGDLAARWDRLAAGALLPTVTTLAFSFDRPTALMTLDTSDETLGTLAWLEPADEEAESEPRVVVAAIHTREPAAGPWRKLAVHTGSAINCMKCGEPFELNIQLWLTSEESEVFFQGEMTPRCAICAGDADPAEEIARPAPYLLIDGGGEGDREPRGKLTKVVDNTVGDAGESDE